MTCSFGDYRASLYEFYQTIHDIAGKILVWLLRERTVHFQGSICIIMSSSHDLALLHFLENQIKYESLVLKIQWIIPECNVIATEGMCWQNDLKWRGKIPKRTAKSGDRVLGGNLVFRCYDFLGGLKLGVTGRTLMRPEESHTKTSVKNHSANVPGRRRAIWDLLTKGYYWD